MGVKGMFVHIYDYLDNHVFTYFVKTGLDVA
jgi:hypothetical protein